MKQELVLCSISPVGRGCHNVKRRETWVFELFTKNPVNAELSLRTQRWWSADFCRAEAHLLGTLGPSYSSSFQGLLYSITRERALWIIVSDVLNTPSLRYNTLFSFVRIGKANM